MRVVVTKVLIFASKHLLRCNFYNSLILMDLPVLVSMKIMRSTGCFYKLLQQSTDKTAAKHTQSLTDCNTLVILNYI